jgi:dTDP-4-amino-4,6-dideoxygalactose transaminase
VSVPFLDLRAQDAEVGAAVRAAIEAVVDTQQLVLGPTVVAFERAMESHCEARHAIGVGSGTDALVLALAALDVRPGDLVVTTPFSFFATASAIVRLGARPLFADIDDASFNLDPEAVRAAVTGAPGRVVGILPVHLYGRLAPMAELAGVARQHGVWLLEDAAQAIGARTATARVGILGRAACLSFYPTKNLGGLGDGGMVLTDDDALAAAIRRDRHQGQVAPYHHETIGLCSRLDALQAAALAAKLPALEGWNARRRAIAARYDAALRARGLVDGPGATLVLPQLVPGHVFHQYVVRATARDALAAALAADGIGSAVYYPTPLHRQPALQPYAVTVGDLPRAERAAREVLALPIYPQLPDDHVERVADAIARFYRGL